MTDKQQPTMSNKQRKRSFELLFTDPAVMYGKPGSGWQPKWWMCKSCDEYSACFDWPYVRLWSVGNINDTTDKNNKDPANADNLVWSFYAKKIDINFEIDIWSDCPADEREFSNSLVNVNAITGEVMNGHDNLPRLHGYLRKMLLRKSWKIGRLYNKTEKPSKWITTKAQAQPYTIVVDNE